MKEKRSGASLERDLLEKGSVQGSLDGLRSLERQLFGQRSHERKREPQWRRSLKRELLFAWHSIKRELCGAVLR